MARVWVRKWPSSFFVEARSGAAVRADARHFTSGPIFFAVCVCVRRVNDASARVRRHAGGMHPRPTVASSRIIRMIPDPVALRSSGREETKRNERRDATRAKILTENSFQWTAFANYLFVSRFLAARLLSIHFTRDHFGRDCELLLLYSMFRVNFTGRGIPVFFANL